MREDKGKKTGKDEIDGWNIGEGKGGRKDRIQKQSNKVYKNNFSDLLKINFRYPVFLIIIHNDVDSVPVALISEWNK
jgi:hypothetical protein